MTEKKDVKDIIQKEETHLNNLLEQQDLTDFKGMVDELRDTWTKKQVFRTCLLYTSPSPRDRTRSRMPSSA